MSSTVEQTKEQKKKNFNAEALAKVVVTRRPKTSTIFQNQIINFFPEKQTVLLNLKRMKQLLSNSDGKDKTLALLQYLAMFTANGNNESKMFQVQKSIAQARKPFRIFKPIEFLLPIIEHPPKILSSHKDSDDNSEDEEDDDDDDKNDNDNSNKNNKVIKASDQMKGIAEYSKAIGMSAYMAFDHVVFLGATGLVTNKQITELCQKLSYYGWFVGSVAGLYQSANELGKCVRDVADADDDEDRKRDIAKVAKPVFTAITTNTLQALLALALLEKIPMKKRNVGALGMALSLLNVYSMFPAAPPQEKAKVE